MVNGPIIAPLSSGIGRSPASWTWRPGSRAAVSGAGADRARRRSGLAQERARPRRRQPQEYPRQRQRSGVPRRRMRGLWRPSLRSRLLHDAFAAEVGVVRRSEEHTSETPVTNAHLVCRLLLEKKKKQIRYRIIRK